MLAACTATFTACNNDESSLPTAGNQLQLSFGINAPQSRAIFTGTKLPDNSPVGVRLDGYADYANLVYTGSTTSGTQSWSSTTSVTLTDTKGTLYAYWPQSNAVSIDAIDVDMTAADQTDWLYATPVADISKAKTEAYLNMNHIAANINITIDKGTYKGEGLISNITLLSDGIALGGTFNAAQTTPGYTAFEDEGKPLSRDVSTTVGTSMDIMVVPTGKTAGLTFMATIDGVNFTATTEAKNLAMGYTYQYTLELSDISKYMELVQCSINKWIVVKETDNIKLKQDLSFDLKTAENGVYGVTKEGRGVNISDVDESCVAVAFIMNDIDEPQRIMIEPFRYNTLFTCWGSKFYGKDIEGVNHYKYAYGGEYSAYFEGTNSSSNIIPKTYYQIQMGGSAVYDFDGKTNTDNIVNAYTKLSLNVGDRDMCKDLITFNSGSSKNLGYNDWYVPACGQLALIYLYKDDINLVMKKIRSQIFNGSYLSSTEVGSYYQSCFYIDFSDGRVDMNSKTEYSGFNVFLIRDIY